MLGSWVADSGSTEQTEVRTDEYAGGRSSGAGSDVFFLYQNGARFRQGWAVKQVEQAWGENERLKLTQ